MRYGIGVDGGGTKTDFGLMDETGAVLALHKEEGSNHEVLPDSYDGAAALVMKGITAVCEKAGVALDAVAKSVLCLAGIDYPIQAEEMTQRLRALGLRDFLLLNDGFAGAMTGFRGNPTVLCNNGTGICFAGIHPNGAMLQIGGSDRLTGDVGGGPQLALRCFQKVYAQFFLRGQPTAMTEPVMTLLECARPEDLMNCSAKIAARFAELVPQMIGILLICASSGDAVANGILSDMQDGLVAAVGGMIDRLPIPETRIDIILAGSIHTKAVLPDYVAEVARRLDAAYDKQFDLRMIDRDPVNGAMAWAVRPEN